MRSNRFPLSIDDMQVCSRGSTVERCAVNEATHPRLDESPSESSDLLQCRHSRPQLYRSCDDELFLFQSMIWPTFQGLRSMCCLKAVPGSDTESLEPVERTASPQAGQRVQRRRLRLRWSSFASEHVPLHREVRVADAFIRDLARRAGVVPREGEVPRVIRQQRWSPLNVPLLWSAAGVEETSPPAQCLIGWPQSQGPCTKLLSSMKVWSILPMRFELVLEL